MPSNVANQPSPRQQLEATYNGPLTPVQMQVIALLIEGGRTMEQLAQEIGSERETIWRWRKKPEFQAEYLKQLRAVEQQAFDYGISRRVERIKALNEEWLKLRIAMNKTRTPRTDHIYALIALQSAAAKELGQDVQNVQIGGRLEITEAVRVIRFTEQEPRAVHGGEGEVVEGEFRDVWGSVPAADPPQPNPDPDPQFDLNLQLEQALKQLGVDSDSSRIEPENLVRVRALIEESGADPSSVLSRKQYLALYGREKPDQGDPWGG